MKQMVKKVKKWTSDNQKDIKLFVYTAAVCTTVHVMNHMVDNWSWNRLESNESLPEDRIVVQDRHHNVYHMLVEPRPEEN